VITVQPRPIRPDISVGDRPARRESAREGAFREPIEAAGRRIGDAALQVVVDGAGGYPFLLQLVGAQTWRLHPDVDEITVEDATLGVIRARRRLAAIIHEPALSAASDIDKSFLLAMAQDDGPAKMADVQQRLDVDVDYASTSYASSRPN